LRWFWRQAPWSCPARLSDFVPGPPLACNDPRPGHPEHSHISEAAKVYWSQPGDAPPLILKAVLGGR
jgi:hypothetical protein